MRQVPRPREDGKVSQLTNALKGYLLAEEVLREIQRVRVQVASQDYGSLVELSRQFVVFFSFRAFPYSD